MTDQATNWRQVRVFAILTVLVSAGGYVLLGITGDTNVILLAAPALSALATKLALQHNLRGLQFGLPTWRWLPVAYVLPIVISGLPFVLYWLVAGGLVDGGQSAWMQLALAAGPVFLTAAIFALGEEIGWRGFLAPELAKTYSFPKVALITGLIWAVWHWPLIFLATDVTGLNLTNPLFAIPVFTVILTAAGTVLAWVTLQSKSIWPAVVLHGPQNAFTHGFFLEVTRQTEISPYFVSEAGGLLAVTWGFAAFVILRRRESLQPSFS